jgi:hypothetical protein
MLVPLWRSLRLHTQHSGVQSRFLTHQRTPLVLYANFTHSGHRIPLVGHNASTPTPVSSSCFVKLRFPALWPAPVVQTRRNASQAHEHTSEGLPVLPSPAVGRWLLCSSALVFAVIVVGGLTRLTESGLSVTEWRPITGVLPPFSADEWNQEFIKYQATPEFKL